MANENDKVVGVFLDEQHAQSAVQMLQAAGVNAQIADKSAIQAFKAIGLDQEVVSMYESRMNEGNSIVTADAGNNGDQVLGMMLDGGAEYINLNIANQGSSNASAQSSTSAQSSQTNHVSQAAKKYKTQDVSQRQYGRVDANTGRAKTADEMRVQLREETLSANKQNVQAGEVQVRKTVEETQQQIPVTLRHEEVVIERHAVDRPATAEDLGDLTEQTISVPVYEERAELQKQTRVTEEVNINKRTQEEQKTLSGTTRKEHLEVTQNGDVEVIGDGKSNVTTQTNTQTTQQTNQQKNNR